jgi:uncharacterized protein YggE
MNTKDITLLQKAGIFTLITVGILALSAVWFMYKSFAQQETRTFNVQGRGEVEVKATKATISADFVSEAKTAKLAIEDLAKVSKGVFAELETAGVKKEDIKTASVSTNPKYDYCYNYTKTNMPDYCMTNPNEGKIVGYTATQNFTVSIDDDKDLVEKVIGLMPSLGARNTYGPNWEVDNKAAIQEARELAVIEAREKAEGIAKSLGMDLGDVQYYSENQGGGVPYPMMYGSVGSARAEMAPKAMDVSVPVSEGTDKVIVNVDITYRLE